MMRGAVILAGLVASLALAAPANAAPQLIAKESRLTPVTALDGTVAWSHFDAASQHFRLMVRRAGKTTTVPIRGRRVPFDASLGHDERGHLVVVYSRCTHEAALYSPESLLPVWATGRGCDLYRASVPNGHEVRIAGAASATRNPALPTQWGNRVAFAATDPRAPSGDRPRTRLYLLEPVRITSGRPSVAR